MQRPWGGKELAEFEKQQGGQCGWSKVRKGQGVDEDRMEAGA